MTVTEQTKLKSEAVKPKIGARVLNSKEELLQGDLVMWDNTGTLHRATAYPLDCGRMMHRTKLEGDEEIV